MAPDMTTGVVTEMEAPGASETGKELGVKKAGLKLRLLMVALERLVTVKE